MRDRHNDGSGSWRAWLRNLLPAAAPAPPVEAPNQSVVEQLIGIEAHVHYGEPPPPGVPPFAAIARKSPVLISAPHGSRALRDRNTQNWHEEDEFTAGMALLLSERCRTSVIANIWRSDGCDPNVHDEQECAYKQQLRALAESQNVRWVLDLHGAAENKEAMGPSRVDLGTRKELQSMESRHRNKLRELIEEALGTDSVSLDVFPASGRGTVTAFCQEKLKAQAIQIEMKPSVRVPLRRIDASTYSKSGPFSAAPERVTKMIGALESFITYLHQGGDAT